MRSTCVKTDTTAPKQMQVRVPADLNAHLRKMAEDQGVSLNLLIATLLAGASGFRREA